MIFGLLKHIFYKYKAFLLYYQPLSFQKQWGENWKLRLLRVYKITNAYWNHSKWLRNL